MSADTTLKSRAGFCTESGEVVSIPILILNVHENCNCRCRMCDIWKRPPGSELSLEKVGAYQEAIRKLNVRQIVLTGGEPLMHSHFHELCGILKQCDVQLTLLTTGLLLKKRSAIIAEAVDEVILSLDGPQEVHDAIRRVPRAYELLREGIQALRMERANMPVHARSTIQSANFRHLRHTVQSAQELQCNSLSFLAVDTTSQAFNRDLVWPTQVRESIGLSSAEVCVLEREVEVLIEEYKYEVESRFIVERPEKLRRIVSYFRQRLGELPAQAPLCNAPWVSAVVELDGSIRPCFFHPKFDLDRDLSLEEAINTAQAKEFRRTLDVESNPVCQRCVCSLHYRG